MSEKKRAVESSHPPPVKPSSTASGEMQRVALDGVLRWALDFDKPARHAMLVVPGVDRDVRQHLFDRYLSPRWEPIRTGTIEDVSGPAVDTWRTEGLVDNLTARLMSAVVPESGRKGLPVWFPPPPGSWELVWGLLSVEEFFVEEPLRTVVDHGSFLAYEFYRLLWEARFLATENVNLTRAQSLVSSAMRWFGGQSLTAAEQELFASLDLSGTPLTTAHRFDLICMLVALAAQNRLLTRYIFAFESLEDALDDQQALNDLAQFLTTLDRWIGMESCPIGVLIGFKATSENMERLREKHPRLASRVEAGLAWTEERSR